MKQIKVNPNNEKYYSSEFIKGFNCGAQRQFEVDMADRKTEPKRGEWLEHEWAEEIEGLIISNYECSECHSWGRDESNFCPNCGADMRKESE